MRASISERSALYTSSITNIARVCLSRALGGKRFRQAIQHARGIARDDVTVGNDDPVQVVNTRPAFELAAEGVLVFDLAQLHHRRNARLVTREAHDAKQP